MRTNAIAASTFLALLGTLLLWGGEPWKEKPYTEWTAEDVQAVLNRSPWVKTVKETYSVGRLAGAETTSLRGGGEVLVGYRPVPDSATGGTLYVPIYAPAPPASSQPVVRGGFNSTYSVAWRVAWYSSLTVRQAIARSIEMSGRKTNASELLSRQPDHYVIALNGGEAASRLSDLPVEELRKSASLQPRGSRQKVLPEKVLFLPKNAPREVHFLFPRTLGGKPVIAPDETKVEFRCERGLKFKVTFDLREMVRNGKPDL